MDSQSKDIVNVKTDQSQRTAVYKPNIWNYEHTEALPIIYADEKYERMLGKLTEEVKCLLCDSVDTLEKLELIDNIDKFGLTYLFENEIKQMLNIIASNQNLYNGEKNLYRTALCFTVLRKHGHHVCAEDMFVGMVDISPETDMKSMLKLFEATHVAFEGECILDKANVDSRKHLMSIIGSTSNDASHATTFHTLEDPYNVWYKVKGQIQFYEKETNSNPHLLNLAKCNFNMFQATHQKELKELLRWWRTLELEESLPFIRNRMMESFVCAIGIVCEPKHGRLRNWLTKTIMLILVVDDVFDVLGGTLEELEIFTSAVHRWDDEETQTLPECMKICLRTLYDTVKDIATQIEEDYGWINIATPYIQKEWSNLCKSLLKEARWYKMEYKPSFEEYTDNGHCSSSGPLLSLHIFFALVPLTTHEQVIHLLKITQDPIQNVALIFRLSNDLGNFAVEIDRCDPAAWPIKCIMEEQGVSEEEARVQIKSMIANAWKKINYDECITQSPLLQSYLKYSINIARVAHVVYHNGDGISNADGMTKKQVMDLLSEPLVLP